MFKRFIKDKESFQQILKKGSKSSSSNSSKSDRIEGKVKLAERLAQETFFEKRQQVENEVQMLMI